MATVTKKGWGTAPFWVDIVAVIALSKAAFVLFMGVIGVAAGSNSQQSVRRRDDRLRGRVRGARADARPGQPDRPRRDRASSPSCR